MVGELYKDMRRSVALYFFILYLLACPILVCAFMDSNQLEQLTSKIVLIIMTCVMVNYCIPSITMSVILQDDENTKWINYAVTLPGGIKTYIKSKYIFPLPLVVSINIILVIADMLMLSRFESHEFIKVLLGAMAIGIGAGLIRGAVISFLQFALGAKKMSYSINILFYVILFALCVWAMFGDVKSFIDKIQPEVIFNFIMNNYNKIKYLVISLPIIGAVLYYLSYLMSVKVLRRKELYFED